MTEHEENSGGLRRRIGALGRFTRLVAAAGIVVVGAGTFQAGSSSASNASVAPKLSLSNGGAASQIKHANSMLKAAPAGYKQQLEQEFMQLAAVTAKYPADFQGKTNLPALLKRSAKDIAGLDKQQLASLYTALSNLPSWNDNLAAQIVTVEQAKAHTNGAVAQMKAYQAHLRAHDDFEFDPTPPNDCSTKAFSNAIYGLIATHIVAEAAATALERVAEGFPDTQVYGVIVAGEGVVATIPVPSPEREPLEAAVLVADYVAQAAEGAKELMEACNQDNFQEMVTAFKEYVHSYVPIKSVQLKVLPANTAGTAFYVTSMMDGQAVAITVNNVWALTPTLASKETAITPTVTTVDATNGVYMLTLPSMPTATGFVLQATTSSTTDPTGGMTVDHTGWITFTKSGG